MLEQLKILIRKDPRIVKVTDRGLEDKDRHVIFVAKDLSTRYPELKQMFDVEDSIDKINESVEEVEIVEEKVEEKVEEVKEVEEKVEEVKTKKSKKKSK